MANGLLGFSGRWPHLITVQLLFPKLPNVLVLQVLAAVKTVLGAEVSVDASLMSAGLDSWGAVELRKELASVTGLDLPTTLVFDYPSTESITDLILDMLPSAPEAGVFQNLDSYYK